LLALLGKSSGMLNKVTHALIDGTAECDKEVTFIMFGNGKYACPLPSTECTADRIVDFSSYVGFDLLTARFDRLMIQLLNNLAGELSLENENYAFVTMAGTADYATQFQLDTDGFFVSLNNVITVVRNISTVSLIVDIVVLVAWMRAFVIPLMNSLSLIWQRMRQLELLIPDRLRERLVLHPDMHTGIPQLDSWRKKLF
jgi:hypothetical protein